jgi:hypothetical protein
MSNHRVTRTKILSLPTMTGAGTYFCQTMTNLTPCLSQVISGSATIERLSHKSPFDSAGIDQQYQYFRLAFQNFAGGKCSQLRPFEKSIVC